MAQSVHGPAGSPETPRGGRPSSSIIACNGFRERGQGEDARECRSRVARRRNPAPWGHTMPGIEGRPIGPAVIPLTMAMAHRPWRRGTCFRPLLSRQGSKPNRAGRSSEAVRTRWASMLPLARVKKKLLQRSQGVKCVWKGSTPPGCEAGAAQSQPSSGRRADT